MCERICSVIYANKEKDWILFDLQKILRIEKCEIQETSICIEGISKDIYCNKCYEKYLRTYTLSDFLPICLLICQYVVVRKSTVATLIKVYHSDETSKKKLSMYVSEFN